MGRSKSSGTGGHTQASVAGVVLIRLFLGVFFIYSGLAMIPSFRITKPLAQDRFMNAFRFVATANLYPTELNGWLGQHNPVRSAVPAVQQFASRAAQSHAPSLAWGIIGAELCIGALLLLGLLTRLAAFIALAMNGACLVYAVRLGMPNLGADVALLVMELAILIAAAGRTFGIDRILARKSWWRIFG